MDTKEQDHRRSSAMSSNNKKGKTEGVRRPHGVAAMDITSYLNGKLETDLEQEYGVPFIK